MTSLTGDLQSGARTANNAERSSLNIDDQLELAGCSTRDTANVGHTSVRQMFIVVSLHACMEPRIIPKAAVITARAEIDNALG